MSLLHHLNANYTPAIAQAVLVPLIEQTAPISLRALDWTVVNWSKQRNAVCSSTIPGQMTNIHCAYKTALHFWKRRLFDPFRRRRRIEVVVGDEVYETTLGQANFILFAHVTGIFAFTLSHLREIEDDMNRVMLLKKKGSKKDKQNTDVINPKFGIAYRCPTIVTFH